MPKKTLNNVFNYFTVSGNATMPDNDKMTDLSDVNFEVNEEAFKPLVRPNQDH